jgi:hypothetical protein
MHESEDHIDLHRNVTVPDYDAEVVAAGRAAFNAFETAAEPTGIELAARQLRLLNEAREERKRIEDTAFMKDAA